MIDSPLATSPPVIGQSMMTDSSLATPTLALSVGLGLEMQKNVVPRRTLPAAAAKSHGVSALIIGGARKHVRGTPPVCRYV